MRTALDADPERIENQEQRFVEQIRKHGWFGTHVTSEAEGPGFSYTTGFWLKFNLPGLFLFSLGPKVAHDTFWHMFRELEAGRRFPIGEPIEAIFENASSYIATAISTPLGWSGWRYGGDDFHVFNWCFPIQAGAFLGRQDRPKVSEQLNRI